MFKRKKTLIKITTPQWQKGLGACFIAGQTAILRERENEHAHCLTSGQQAMDLDWYLLPLKKQRKKKTSKQTKH